MSRSYRKFPSVKCAFNRCGKKFANRRVRRFKGDIGNNSDYKKLYNQWDIADYRDTEFRNWVIEDYYKYQSYLEHGVVDKTVYSTLDEALGDWKKFYMCK